MEDIIGGRMSMWWYRKVVSNTLLKCLGREARAFNLYMRPFNLQLSLHNIALLALPRRDEEQNPATTSLLNSSTHCLEGEYDSLLRITFTIADNAEFRSKISLESCFNPWATRVDDFCPERGRGREREREERER
jgi:hypothetical protein